MTISDIFYRTYSDSNIIVVFDSNVINVEKFFFTYVIRGRPSPIQYMVNLRDVLKANLEY